VNKAAIVVGATSMLGRRVSEHLRKNGFDVITCGRSFRSDIVLDLSDCGDVSCPETIQADALIHCAATFAGDNLDGMLENERVNALGSLTVARLAEQAKCSRLVFAGTIISYPLPDGTDMSSYGSSKGRGEQLMMEASARFGATCCSLRLAQLYDEYGDCFAKQAWLRRIMAYAGQGADLALPPSPHKQNFLHVEDAAALLTAVVSSRLSGIWPATHPVSNSYMEIAGIAYDEFGRGGDIVEDSTKRPFTERYIPDSSALYEALGYGPLISMRDGIRQLIQSCVPERFGELDVA
jgi:nucleoside-diphosphate-sugar epimerase